MPEPPAAARSRVWSGAAPERGPRCRRRARPAPETPAGSALRRPVASARRPGRVALLLVLEHLLLEILVVGVHGPDVDVLSRQDLAHGVQPHEDRVILVVVLEGAV